MGLVALVLAGGVKGTGTSDVHLSSWASWETSPPAAPTTDAAAPAYAAAPPEPVPSTAVPVPVTTTSLPLDDDWSQTTTTRAPARRAPPSETSEKSGTSETASPVTTRPATTSTTVASTTVLAAPVAPAAQGAPRDHTHERPDHRHRHEARGLASWFNAPDRTCAHTTIPKGTIVTVTRVSTGASTTCKVDQWGPADTTRIIDLSMDTFAKLAPPEKGLIEVILEW